MNIHKSFIITALAIAAATTTANAAPHKPAPSHKPAITTAPAPTHATLFGITLGSAFAVPDCPQEYNTYGHIDRYSVKTFCAESLDASLASETTQERNVYFAHGSQPVYLQFAFIIVTVRNATVQKILVYTDGIRSQELVLAELLLKFGKPRHIDTEKASNMMGTSFQVKTATWKVGSDDVLFTGSIGTFTSGMFTATTADQAAFEAAKEAEKHKGAPEL